MRPALSSCLLRVARERQSWRLDPAAGRTATTGSLLIFHVFERAQKRPDVRRAAHGKREVVTNRLCGCRLQVTDDPVSPRLLRRAPDNVQSRAPRIFTISRLHSAAQVLFPRGGAEGIRTPDLRRAKAALSQLSYGPARSFVEWASLESNQGPQSYQDCALAD
jgi:hypothetical protein